MDRMVVTVLSIALCIVVLFCLARSVQCLITGQRQQLKNLQDISSNGCHWCAVKMSRLNINLYYFPDATTL